MTQKLIRVSRARDPRADRMLQEAIDESDTPPEHASSHSKTGADALTPGMIGAETSGGAQQKVDIHENKENPHSGSQPVISFTTANRPSGVDTGYMGFDTDLGIPIWWNGSNWTDATGVAV